MTTWTISDGTKITHGDDGVAVKGRSPFAETIRAGIASAVTGLAPQVEIVPPPGGGIPLDPGNRWVVDRWLRMLAAPQQFDLATTYDAPLSEAPRDAQDLLAMDWDSEEGVIY